MLEKGWGRIVNMSSSAGRSVSMLGGAHYTAGKAALLGLTRALAKEVGAAGEVAALVGFLCSDEAAYITAAALDINGGDLMI